MTRWSLFRREKATPFFVKKKDGRLRLIIDARRFNRRCLPPPKSQLGSAAALMDLELGENDLLSFAASDIQDCFHHFELPEHLQEFFGLEPLLARILGIKRINGTTVGGDTPIFPLIQTAPMGCSWSMYWCQRAHERCLDRAAVASPELGIGPSARVQDRRPFPVDWCRTGSAGEKLGPRSQPAPSAQCVNLVHADNNAVFGVNAGAVAKAYAEVCQAVSRARLPLHEKTSVIHEGEFLGVAVDGIKGFVGPSNKRIWRVRMAFDYLCRRPRVSGDEILHLLGHATYLFLFNGGLLSIFRHLYDFAAALGPQRARLWESAAQEARWVRDLVALARCSLRHPWSPSVFCSDASEDGFGVMRRSVDVHLVREAGRHRERWRFGDDGVLDRNPRDLALSEERVSEGEVGRPSFPEIGRNLLGAEEEWSEVAAGAWNRLENIFILEGRAALMAQQKALVETEHHHSRMVFSYRQHGSRPHVRSGS